MERQGDGEEPLGGLNHHGEAQEPGKRALLLHAHVSLQILQKYVMENVQNNRDNGVVVMRMSCLL